MLDGRDSAPRPAVAAADVVEVLGADLVSVLDTAVGPAVAILESEIDVVGVGDWPIAERDDTAGTGTDATVTGSAVPTRCGRSAVVVRRSGSGRSVRALRITRAAAAAVGVDTTARPALETGVAPALVSIEGWSLTRRATAAVDAERNTAARETGDVTAEPVAVIAADEVDGPASAATRSARGRLRSLTISAAVGVGDIEGPDGDATGC